MHNTINMKHHRTEAAGLYPTHHVTLVPAAGLSRSLGARLRGFMYSPEDIFLEVIESDVTCHQRQINVNVCLASRAAATVAVGRAAPVGG